MLKVPGGASPEALGNGESHSPVVHELWVLVVAGSNPASPTHFLAQIAQFATVSIISPRDGPRREAGRGGNGTPKAAPAFSA